MAAPIIGIDLGTTNSCAAICDEAGEVKLIPYRGGEYTMPSIFAIDDKGNELVGHEAKRQWQLNPTDTVFGSKRLVGTNNDSALVTEMRDHVAYKMVEAEDGGVAIPVGGRNFRLHEISGKILARIRDFASDHLGTSITRAVVTVPAYFNDRQRQAVYKAGTDIGLEIIRIINEPTAAALAYGAREQRQESVVIYDLGGGTFDVSVIEIRDSVFEVKATGGDIFLGGLDFDNALIQYVVTDFSSKYGIDLQNDPVAMQRIRDIAERVKMDLSEAQEVPMNIPFVTMTEAGKPLDIELTMTRDEFHTLTEHLVEKTFVTVARVINDAGLTPDQVGEILLVGGQTRMPLIQERVLAFFNKAPSKTVHPDEAVAIGAALFAFSLEDKSNLKIQLLDVLPMAIGIEAASGDLHKLFERNTSVPNRKAFTFTTHKHDQKDLAMRLFQGDHPKSVDNQPLGAFTFSGLRAGPAGSVKVEVIFDVNSEGIIALDARDLDTGAMMQQSVRYGKDQG